jgi:hypothetical protein
MHLAPKEAVVVWRWWLSLLLGLLTIWFVTTVLEYALDGRGAVAALLVSTAAGMVVAYRTTPVQKWLSAVLVPVIFFVIGWLILVVAWITLCC